MLKAIGIAAQKEREWWLGRLRSYRPQEIVETSFYGDTSASLVDVWLVAPDRTESPISYAPWLCSLKAPIVLVTRHTRTAFDLSRAIPFLTYICHPYQAEYHLDELLYLAAHRSAGVSVVDAPRHCRVETALLRGAT